MNWIRMVVLVGGLLLCCPVPGLAQTKRPPDLERLSWLLGNWKAVQRNKNVHEDWREVSPQTFEGVGYITLFDGTKRIKESLRLVAMGGEVFYIVKVEENKLPVAFKLEELAEGKAVFANPEHSSPRRITYLHRDGTLTAIVEGKKEISGSKVQFRKVL